jgi:hypothetical protein
LTADEDGGEHAAPIAQPDFFEAALNRIITGEVNAKCRKYRLNGSSAHFNMCTGLIPILNRYAMCCRQVSETFADRYKIAGAHHISG